MTIQSGKFGIVDGESTVRSCAINDLSSPQKYVASNTRGGSGRKPGIRDWNGTFDSYGAVPVRLPGDVFAFQMYSAPTTGVGGTNGSIWAGSAIIDQVAITWNWGNGEIISTSSGFSGNGALTQSLDAALTDVTDPDVPIPCGTKITYSDTPDIEWENLVQATLTITAANESYVNSSTIENGECWTKRKPGVIDWTLSVTEQDDEGLPAEIDISQDESFKLWVNDTEFWDLEFGHVGDASGLTVNRETGAITQRTVNIAMNGFDTAIGKIQLPGAVSAWWPFVG